MPSTLLIRWVMQGPHIFTTPRAQTELTESPTKIVHAFCVWTTIKSPARSALLGLNGFRYKLYVAVEIKHPVYKTYSTTKKTCKTISGLLKIYELWSDCSQRRHEDSWGHEKSRAIFCQSLAGRSLVVHLQKSSETELQTLASIPQNHKNFHQLNVAAGTKIFLLFAHPILQPFKY